MNKNKINLSMNLEQWKDKKVGKQTLVINITNKC